MTTFTSSSTGAVPTLPQAPEAYDPEYFNQLNKTLSAVLFDMQRYRGGKWPFMRFTGTWTSTVKYSMGDVVVNAAGLYLAIDPADTSIGASPPTPEGWWQLC